MPRGCRGVAGSGWPEASASSGARSKAVLLTDGEVDISAEVEVIRTWSSEQ
jgi:hypothetical protein